MKKILLFISLVFGILFANEYGALDHQNIVYKDANGKGKIDYIALFIPDGFTKTLGELDNETKLKISHRSKGLELANFVLKSLKKNYK